MAQFATRAVHAVIACCVAFGLVAACGSDPGSEFDGGGTDPNGDAAPPPPLGTNTPDSAPPPGVQCKPKTCQEQGIECGPSGDGCGGIIEDCGKCGAGLRCGGPDAPSKCVSPNIGTGCVPKTCAEVGVECGPAGDGCGAIIECGTCGTGMQCGATGTPSKCVPATPTGPDGGTCVRKTCADYRAQNMDCGLQSDGCGGTIDCGQCVAPAFCGGGGPSKCAVQGGGTCTKKTCAAYPGKCGPQPDGCGGVTASCGSCTAPQTCGGGGAPSVCGGGNVTGPDGGACVPRTCQPGQCGTIADGCGKVINCGNSCPAGQVCGGSGTPNACGAPACTRITTCPAGMNCGSISDGCGGTISCGGACTAPAICGGGGQPNVCGGGGVTGDGGAPCTPLTCAQAGKNCGPVANGCGGILQCGNCTSPDVCGGGGTPSVCGGGNQCTKRTQQYCVDHGLNCGFIADGCGGLVQCGATCPGGGVCGATTPNVCGGTDGGAGGCTNFCQHISNSCQPGSRTRISGKIFAPNNTLPIPDAVIYVPNGSMTAPYGVTPITAGVAGAGSCDQCNQSASGSPLVSTRSLPDGSFTLNDVPAGIAFPLVIQLGKWRRMVTIPAVTACTERVLAPSEQLTRLPRRQNEGNNGVDNIPLVAISTGSVDGLECVFRKLGIEDSQFTNPAGSEAPNNGRIRFYRDHNEGGARITRNTPRTRESLTDDDAHMNQYDAVVFGCTGAENDQDDDVDDRVRRYANRGGRVFATHYNYVYLYDRAPWNNTVSWQTTGQDSDSAGDGQNATWIGRVNNSPGKRATFAQWLGDPAVNALTGPNELTIVEPRNNADIPVANGAEEWITYARTGASQTPASGPTPVLHYTFNTPWGSPPAQQCGRVLFSDFHVSIGNTSNATFPDECPNTGLTAQEKVLAFFLFDLTSCITTTPPPTCTPRTCASYPAGTCGRQADGCGGVTPDCGSCPAGQICGGGGTPNRCGGPTCTRRTCAQAGAACGTIPDGCGGTVDCGNCTSGRTCGGGGTAYQCGTPTCTPRTCPQMGASCGQTGNGCGGLLNCGSCPAGQTCGGGGVPNQCGAPQCTNRLTQCPPGKECGQIPDNCGGVLNCGTCPNGEACGGGGTPNVCGSASCSPRTCAAQNAECGQVSDGCGAVLSCGGCPDGDFCNGQNLCVSRNCTPKTCQELGVQCGPTADGCGGIVQCGNCPGGQGCGAGGVPGQCGTQQCTPKTCQELGAVCGQVANGCGALTPDCGTCQGAQSCKNGACVAACTPRTCASVGANCGSIADGCGGLLDCGACPSGQECGFGGVPNVCGSNDPR